MSYNKKVICNILKNFDCYVASLVLVVLVILTFFGAIWRYLLHSPLIYITYTYLSNARQISLIKECVSIIKQIEKANKEGVNVDLIEIDLKRLWDKLGEITGETYKDELLDEIFSKFCLGK